MKFLYGYLQDCLKLLVLENWFYNITSWNYCNSLALMLTISTSVGCFCGEESKGEYSVMFCLVLTCVSQLPPSDTRDIWLTATMLWEHYCLQNLDFPVITQAVLALCHTEMLKTSVSSAHVPHLISSSAKADTRAVLTLSKPILANCSFFRVILHIIIAVMLAWAGFSIHTTCFSALCDFIFKYRMQN